MKKLNALALCAVMAPAYALGIGSVMAAEGDDAAATQTEARQSPAVEHNRDRNDGSSAATTDARQGDNSAEMSKDGSEDLGEPYTAQQDPDEPMAAEGDAASRDSSSAADAEARDQRGMANAPNDEAAEPGSSDRADMAADTTSGDAGPAFHADDLIGRDVTSSSDGATIGSISDLVFSEDGQLLSVIVGVGGFLGMGDKEVAIAWSEVERQADPDGDGYVITVDRDSQSLQDAEAYDRSLAHSTSAN